ncbi:MAG: 16S rRNA (cytidine(1402)-2'-O)-methyltransferase [Rhodothermia bacterium]
MLYVVPTPIGNLGDMTVRAIQILNNADLVACEDTRTSHVLLAHYDISTPTTSFHDHNARSKAPRLARRMLDGETVALISDAGTPGISDPGFILIRECLEQGVGVEVLPGATALVPALLLSGLATHRFVFEGFLPPKKGRRSRLAEIANEARTVILYESPHRLLKTLRDIEQVAGPDRQIAVSRELTKKFEETRRGSISEVLAYFEAKAKVRGEFVIVLGA